MCIRDSAYIDPLDSNSTKISGNWKKLIEGVDYEIDRLLGHVRLNSIMGQEAVAIGYTYGNYDINTGNFVLQDECLDQDYDGTSEQCIDYIDYNEDQIFTPPFLFNGTDVELIYDECLDEGYDGTNEECIDYIENNEIDGFQSQEPKSVNLKLIKLDSPTTPNHETWSLMFKNVYSLGGSIADLSSLELDIVYNLSLIHISEPTRPY